MRKFYHNHGAHPKQRGLELGRPEESEQASAQGALASENEALGEDCSDKGGQQDQEAPASLGIILPEHHRALDLEVSAVSARKRLAETFLKGPYGHLMRVALLDRLCFAHSPVLTFLF
jgi:hypothetical protein